MRKLFLPLLVLIVFACKKAPDKPVERKDSIIHYKSEEKAQVQPEMSKKEVLKQANNEILHALKNKNYVKFSEFIHPEKGVRFSMYAFVDPKGDKQFSRADFQRYFPTKTLFTWGMMDGSGDPYKATVNEYFEKWVFSKDFTASQYSFNIFQGSGNSLNNLKEIYPKADFTENYIKGTEKYGEMDWKTLRFVFEEFQGKYYLIGVINDQWTV
ncbi:hypothetical protein HNP38_001302 [Chryseobacterium defluvii]|uniref:Uncharacterized protein n=1 Tax=Chryseobacterium defluvii TaxID=160396 RepID=A0A840KES7_9FLAO|nr:hypothetical protein [Chryseobacterium defluvii]MBB4806030.1 hypothetical protein [Chryseobacterium defluvii]